MNPSRESAVAAPSLSPSLPLNALPNDVLPVDEVAHRLGRSRRTLDRWASQHPEELPRYSRMAPDGTARVLLSWRTVEIFCLNHQKAFPPEVFANTFQPDPALSDTVAHTPALADSPDSVSDTPAASPGSMADSVSDTLTVTLQAEVARLSALLGAAGDARERIEAAHGREVVLLETQLTEMKAAHAREVEGLQAGHAREVAGLREELAARRGEATEARQTAERRERTEAALRWQAATLQSERNSALAELEAWAGAGLMRRLFSRPASLRLTEASEVPGEVVVVSGEGKE